MPFVVGFTFALVCFLVGYLCRGWQDRFENR